MLKRLSRLPLLRQLIPRREAGSILWVELCNGGVVVALARDAEPAAVTVALSDRSGPIAGPAEVVPKVTAEGRLFAHLPVPPEVFATARTCRIEARSGRHALSRKVETGPGRAVIRFDGVAAGCLRGWASSLSGKPSLDVALVVDGVVGEARPPDRFRLDLMQVAAEGGWNGFACPLPAAARDGRPHDLAVRAGTVTVPFGRWSSRPSFHVDHVGPERLTGWFIDQEELDEAATIRLTRDGRTVASLETGPRSDLKETFGRDHGAFAFVGTPVVDGMEVMVGPEGTQHRLGRVRVDDLLSRVTTLRAEARRLLLGEPFAATLKAREAIRADLVRTRDDPPATFTFEPGARAAAPASPPPAAVLPARPPSPAAPAACVIVPVYKGLADTRDCLRSILPQLGDGVRAVVIDDASPEPELRAYLAALEAEGVSGLAILRNDVNLGFIGTVNRAFGLLGPDEDAVLVNADTILPPDGIRRLARICHTQPGIASVTPMSNNATILSFPDPSARINPPALGLGTAEIDAAFQAVGAGPVEIPTGIGFCMYLNGRALAEMGPFSPEWGRGYCEEVDWSLGARDLGWRHLAARDVFVMHEGSVSFGAAERSTILEVNHARLEAKYPDYLGEVHAVVAADPSSAVRVRVLSRLLASRFATLTLFLTHGLGGGTKRYIDDLSALGRRPDHEVAVMRPVETGLAGMRLHFAFDGGASLEIAPGDFDGTLSILEAAGLELNLHVNSRLVFPAALLESIMRGRRPYAVTLHDFQWYCPKVHLVDERSFYCGEPTPEICQLCVRHHQEHDFGDQNALIQRDIESWIAFNERILRGASRLIAPSRDTADRYERRLGLSGIAVVPHPERPRPPAPSAVPAAHGRTGAVRIALVGAIGFHKGFDLVVRMAEHAERRRLPVYFRVVGYTPDGERLERLSNADVTGPYDPAELKAHLDAFDPDFVFLSSVWPETYSYVLSEVWAAGYPVAAFGFGAPAERIRESGGGVLVEPTRDAGIVLDALLAARANPPALPPRDGPTALPSLEEYLA